MDNTANLLSHRISSENQAWSIREAIEEDLSIIAEIEKEIYLIEGAWELSEFQESFAQDNTLYLVAVAGGQVIGYAAAEVTKNVGELIASTVIPEYRRMGIAKEFLRLRLEWLDSQVKEVELETRVDNEIILHNYKAYGFNTSELLLDYYAQGIHAFKMRRVIKS